MAQMRNALTVRLEAQDTEKLDAAAQDLGVTRHEMARLVIQYYLAGWHGPYVMKRAVNPGWENEPA